MEESFLFESNFLDFPSLLFDLQNPAAPSHQDDQSNGFAGRNPTFEASDHQMSSHSNELPPWYSTLSLIASTHSNYDGSQVL